MRQFNLISLIIYWQLYRYLNCVHFNLPQRVHNQPFKMWVKRILILRLFKDWLKLELSLVP